MTEKAVSGRAAYTKFSMLLLFLRGSKRFFSASILASAAVAGLDMVTPQVIRIVVDGCLSSQTETLPGAVRHFLENAGGREFIISHLYLAAVAVLAAAVLTALFQYLTNLLNAQGTERMMKTARDTLYRHIERLPYAWHMQNQTGDIIQRCTSDVTIVRDFISEQLVQVVRIAILILFSVLVMLSMSLKLSLVVFISVPLIIGYSYFFYHRIGHLFLKCDENEGVLSTITQENLTGVRVVRAFGRENYERERFRKQNHVYTDTWMDLCKLLSWFWAAGDLVMGFQLMLLVVLGAVLCVRGSLTAGMLIAFISYNRRLIWPVRRLGRMISEMSKAGVSMDRLLYILNSETEPDDAGAREAGGRSEGPGAGPRSGDARTGEASGRSEDTDADAAGLRPGDARTGEAGGRSEGSGAGPRSGDAGTGEAGGRSGDTDADAAGLRPEEAEAGEGPDMRGDIVFRNVSFGYTDAEKILRDISLTVRGGTTLGILGSTGSGKSTLMHLLNRLYELQEGDITIGGVSVRDIPLPWLRSHIGMVLQESYLFSRTIEENLTITGSYGQEEIRHAAQVACIDESIERFTKGYQTMVGERGVTLSGGQKQRMAIARMLMQNAPIMVFDDSLSAVDTETDERIRRALKQYMGHATVILISHRISTLMNADQIIVLDRGRIVQRGTHQELIGQDGPYREIYELQSPEQEEQEKIDALQGSEQDTQKRQKRLHQGADGLQSPEQENNDEQPGSGQDTPEEQEGGGAV